MMKLILSALLVVFLHMSASAHGEPVKHTLKVVDGGLELQDIPNSVVYIAELEKEYITNEKGELSISLPAGKYTLYVSSLGYDEYELNVSVEPQGFTLIDLHEAPTSISPILSNQAQK